MLRKIPFWLGKIAINDSKLVFLMPRQMNMNRDRFYSRKRSQRTQLTANLSNEMSTQKIKSEELNNVNSKYIFFLS